MPIYICDLHLLIANAVQNCHKCLGAANILTIFIQVFHFMEETYPMFRFLQKIERIY